MNGEMLLYFANFEIDTELFELRRAGVPVTIQRKPLQVLLYLIEHAGRIVSTEELMNAAWSSVSVTPASVRSAIKLVREALDDRDRAIVGASPGYGYRFLAEIRRTPSHRAASTTGMLTKPSRIRRFSPFVGRDFEFGVLERTFDAACTGHGGFVVLEGPAGIGKTRLFREFGELARARGAQTIWGQCWDHVATPPYWPWGDMFTKMKASLDPSTCERHGAPPLDLLGPSKASVADSPVSDQQRFALFSAGAELVRQLADAGPLVLVLDDIHEAHEPALLLLEFIVRGLRDVPLLVLGAHRGSPGADDPRSRALRQVLTRARAVMMHPLNASEVRLLARATLGEQASESLIERIRERSMGNPFYVEQLVVAFANRPNDVCGSSPAASDHDVPVGIRRIIDRELSTLPSEVREFLRLAAVMGNDLSLIVAADVLAVPEHEVLDLLDRASAGGVVLAVGVGRLCFTHALFRDTLYAGLASADRLALHQRVADALERSGADSTDHGVAQIAYHLLKCAPRGDPTRRVDFATRAGDAAARRLAHEEARELYLKALAALAEKGAPAERRLALLMRLGDAQRLCGMRTQAQATFREACALARSSADVQMVARAVLGYAAAHYETGFLEIELIELIEEALELLPPSDGPERVALLSRLGEALHFTHQVERRCKACKDAVAMAHRLRDERSLALALQAEVACTWGVPDPEIVASWESRTLESLKAARAVRDLDAIANATIHRIAALAQIGAVTEAKQLLATSSKDPGLGRHRLFCYHRRLTLAAWALWEGRLDEAGSLMADARSWGERFDIPTAAALEFAQRFLKQREEGNLDPLIPTLISTSEVEPARWARRAAACLAYVDVGRPEDARAQLEQLAAFGFDNIPQNHNWFTTFTICAEAASLLEGAPYCRLLYEKLRPYREYMAAVGTLIGIFGLVSYTLGVLAIALGEIDEAVSHLDFALVQCLRSDAGPWLARTQCVLAEALRLRGGGDDVDRASRVLEQAVSKAGAVGMRLPELRLARAIGALKDRDAVPPVRAVRAGS